MKFLKYILIVLLLASTAEAQTTFNVIRNDDAATVIQSNNLGNSKISTDGNGVAFVRFKDSDNLSVIPVSNATTLTGLPTAPVGYGLGTLDLTEAASTTTVINATAHVARAGDAIFFIGGTAGNVGVWAVVASVATNTITLSNALPATPGVADSFYIYRPQPLGKPESSQITSGDSIVGAGLRYNTSLSQISSGAQNDYVLGAVGAYGENLTTLIYDNSLNSDTIQLLKLEDAAGGSGQPLIPFGGIRSDPSAGVLPTLTTTDGDWSNLGLNSKGGVRAEIYYDSSLSGTSTPFVAEDAGRGNGDTLIKNGLLIQSALTAEVGATNEYGSPKLDWLGRQVVSFAPAGETWQSCGTATATTGDTAIKAAVASNRIYVTTFNCSSSDADNATNLNFKDGSTVIAVGGVNQMATVSSGSFVATFNPPLRGTSNTALNFNTAVSTSSVICCASGYVAVD